MSQQQPKVRDLVFWNSDMSRAVDSACNEAEEYAPDRRKAFLQQLAQAIAVRADECKGDTYPYLDS